MLGYASIVILFRLQCCAKGLSILLRAKVYLTTNPSILRSPSTGFLTRLLERP